MTRHLLLFRSTRAVIKAERLLRGHDLSCKVIPVPRTISSECGMAIEIRSQEREQIITLLAEAEISCTPVSLNAGF
jgi:hypothetical protein